MLLYRMERLTRLKPQLNKGIFLLSLDLFVIIKRNLKRLTMHGCLTGKTLKRYFHGIFLNGSAVILTDLLRAIGFHTDSITCMRWSWFTEEYFNRNRKS